MLAVMMQTYLSRLPIMVGPVLLWMLLNYFHFYKGTGVKKHAIGLVICFFTSFPFVYLISVFIYYGLLSILPASLLENALVVAVLSAAVYTVAGTFLMIIYDRAVPKSLEGVDFIIGQFCGYLYAEYMIIIYVTMLIASTPLSFFCWYLGFSALWYFAFKRDIDFLKMGYPRQLFSSSNLLIFWDYLITALLWAMPAALLKVVSEDAYQTVVYCLSMLAILIYVFCVLIHKIITSELKHRLREEFYMNSDELTGLVNRRYFLEKSDGLLKSGNVKPNEFACIYLDIADFKYFNDNHGAEVGDYVLQKIGRELRSVFGLAAGISRFADDHFAVFTWQVEEAEQLVETLNENIRLDEKCADVHVRYGIYITTGQEKDALECVECALRACKEVNAKEGEVIRYFNHEMDQIQKLEHYVVEHVDQAIREKWITVFYQPIMEAESGELIAAETLVRWGDPQKGMLGANFFIPALEKYNLTYKVDQFVVETVCRGFRENLDRNGEVYPASVNISRKDFFYTDMVDYIDKCVEKYNLDKGLLKIEITESAFVEDDGMLQKQIERLRELGYKVWMDDFGSGLSSLNAVGEFGFDGIKMDMVFLRNMSERNREIMRGIVTVARRLGLEVLFEGVELQEQYDFVKTIDANMVQGFLFSEPKPMSAYLDETE